MAALFGVILAVASKVFVVRRDPRVEKLVDERTAALRKAYEKSHPRAK